mmetsp:Transcript_26209/g.41563  ORF Transcript_26209/g.41563 Transcript_26209/m.41563 type:complete len:320 (+) Transcript_26209:331-1290(+)
MIYILLHHILNMLIDIKRILLAINQTKLVQRIIPQLLGRSLRAKLLVFEFGQIFVQNLHLFAQVIQDIVQFIDALWIRIRLQLGRSELQISDDISDVALILLDHLVNVVHALQQFVHFVQLVFMLHVVDSLTEFRYNQRQILHQEAQREDVAIVVEIGQLLFDAVDEREDHVVWRYFVPFAETRVAEEVCDQFVQEWSDGVQVEMLVIRAGGEHLEEDEFDVVFVGDVLDEFGQVFGFRDVDRTVCSVVHAVFTADEIAAARVCVACHQVCFGFLLGVVDHNAVESVCGFFLVQSFFVGQLLVVIDQELLIFVDAAFLC